MSDSQSQALLIDQYELTMAASYLEHRPNHWAAFDLFIRKFPSRRSFFVAGGLDDAVDYIQGLRFDAGDLAYLQSLDLFSEKFLSYLGSFRFRGSVWAMKEGSVFFPNEPVLRAVGPLIEAQILESCLLNTVNLQTMIATKAARVMQAAGKRAVLDFSLRRTHGPDAANKVARASYLAGFKGTSNLMGGKLYDIPVSGTMAHSFVMAFDGETDAFRAFARTFPGNTVLLVDTYDTIKGVKKAVVVAREMESQGKRLRAIRLDSGKLDILAQKSRRILDKAGLEYVKIFASGSLDEYKIEKLTKSKAPIDAFGVGTNMGVSEDAPYCDVIYKLSEIGENARYFHPTMKLSSGKFTYPGRKQVFRFKDRRGKYKKDVIGLEAEPIKGRPLLGQVMEKGRRLVERPPLKAVKDRTLRNLSALPRRFRELNKPAEYPVEISAGLDRLTREVSSRIKQTKI